MAWLQGAFYGVGAAVIAIIARSAAQLALVARGRTNDTGQSAASFAFVLPASTTLTSVIDGKWFLTGLAGVASLAIVPFLHGGVVLQHHWLSEQQFLDAVAVALIAALRAVQIQSARSGLYRWSHCGGDWRDCRRDNRAWSLGNRRLDHDRDCDRIADGVATHKENTGATGDNRLIASSSTPEIDPRQQPSPSRASRTYCAMTTHGHRRKARRSRRFRPLIRQACKSEPFRPGHQRLRRAG